MLRITIPAKPPEPPKEFWDERNQEFIYVPGKPGTKEQKLQLEHSLVSLSKWESKWCKPFLSNKGLTDEEAIDYIRCMTLTQNVPPEVYDNITEDIVKQVTDYINAPMTATTFSDSNNSRKSNEIITNEVIYYWMVALQIPSEYQKWHLNRLLTLIRVCNIKNAPPKKMNRRDTASQYAKLNAARRKQWNTKG